MSDDSPKALILQAIDTEITSINERHRLQGLTSWAIGAAIILLLGAAATAWEAGGLRWPNVAALFLAIVLAADVTATLMNRNSPPSALSARSPLQLWAHPTVAAMTQQSGLFAIAYSLQNAVPQWWTVLALLTFGGGVIVFGALQPALARRLSRTKAIQATWTSANQGPRDATVRGVLFVLRRLRPAIYAVLAVIYGRAAYAIRPGEPLRDVRFAVIAALIVVLMGLAMKERVAPLLIELKDLRRDATLDRVSPSDATDAFLAIVAGIDGAPYTIAICREAIQALKHLRAEVESTLQVIGDQGNAHRIRQDISDLCQRVTALNVRVQQLWSITKTQQSMYEVIRPQGARLLARILGELETQYEAFNVCDRALSEVRVEMDRNFAGASDA